MKKSEKDYLRKVPLLAELSDDELEVFSSILKPVKIKEGEIIVVEGESGENMYLFREGLVEVTAQITLPVGEKKNWFDTEKSIARMSPDKMTFFGEMSLITGAPRSARIKALQPCLLYEITKEDFENLAIKYPVIGYKILKAIVFILSNRIRELNQSVLKLTTALSIVVSKQKK